MTKSRTQILFILTGILLAIIPVSCSQSGKDSAQAKPEELSPRALELNTTARFLAGLLKPHELGFLPETDQARYAKTSVQTNRAWNGFFAKNKGEIMAWRDVNLTDKNITRVFYPFSGPDILHPLTFFPDVEDIVMFGLEPTGGVPTLKGAPAKTLAAQPEAILDAVNFILNHSFFVTSEMMNKVKKSSLNGVTAVMYFFLAREGYTILDTNEIVISPEGLVSHGVKTPENDRGHVAGIEVIFRGKDNKKRRARYYRIDIADGSPQLARFFGMVRTFSPHASIVKSASYLMSYHTFTGIRNLVLEKSPIIVQDDSGIGYSFFKKSDWDISYYGKYHKPLPVFKHRYQKDLEDDVTKYTKGPINFVYGYGYGYDDMTYHIIVARRKKKE